MSDVATGAAYGTLIAFVPCRRFKSDGLYVLRAGNGFELCNCRALDGGRGIEAASVSKKDEVAVNVFNDLVEGRVIGFALLEPQGGEDKAFSRA